MGSDGGLVRPVRNDTVGNLDCIKCSSCRSQMEVTFCFHSAKPWPSGCLYNTTNSCIKSLRTDQPVSAVDDLGQESNMLTQEYQHIPALRNCPRCGTDFRSGGSERVCQACRRPAGEHRPLSHDLSFRERQVVDLVRQAKPNKEIAYQLHLSEGTVKEYLNRIFRKLDVSNRTELAVWAMTHRAECVVMPHSGMTERLLVNQ